MRHLNTYRPGAPDTSFHVVFLRALISLNVLLGSPIIKIWKFLRFINNNTNIYIMNLKFQFFDE